MASMHLEAKIPPLGLYLARIAEGAAAVEQAVRTQAELREKGIYKPIGQIVLEDGRIDRQFLEECLREQRTDILALLPQFSCLPRASLMGFAAVLQNIIIPEGETVFRAGEPGDTYTVVSSGRVAVTQEKDGRSVTVGIRGPGEDIGEVSLLTGRLHSTTATTIERSSLILIPRNIYLQTVFSHPEAARTCAAVLADRLDKGYAQIVDESMRGEGYLHLMSEAMRPAEQPFVGSSPVAKKLRAQAAEIAVTGRPILVLGEAGTELHAVASMFPGRSLKPGAGHPLEMDAQAVAARVIGDANDAAAVEQAQAAALFGRGRDALSFAGDRRPGILTMAEEGVVVVGNIECLAARVQEQLADAIETGWYRAMGELQPLALAARIVATSTADLAAQAAAGVFNRRLFGLISAQTVTVPPLRRRKQDLRVIVDEMLRQSSKMLGKQVLDLDAEAYHALMGYDWPGNTAELGLVIHRAVSICRSGTLGAEDLFIGPSLESGRFTFDLLHFRPVERLLRHPWYPAAAVFVTAPFLALAVALGLLGPDDPTRNVALVLVWGLWEPTVIASTLVASRAWCAICPIGFLSLALSRIGLGLKPPALLRNYGFVLAGLAIALIFWAEAASDMPHSPRATAMLILSITALGIGFGLLFQRRTWCRHACGLGSMVGTYATCSALEARSNAAVCNTSCVGHECYSGSADREGCQLFSGPFALTSNLNCVLCGSCTKICTHRSPRLNVRIPAYDLWAQRMPDRAVAVLATVLVGTQFFRGIGYAGFFGRYTVGSYAMWSATGLLMAACVAAAVVFVRATGRVIFANDEQGTAAHRFAYAVLPLCLSYELGYQLNRFLVMAGQLLPVAGRQFGFGEGLPGGTPHHAVVLMLQVPMVLAGCAASVMILSRQLRYAMDGPVSVPRASIPLLALAACYIALFMAALPGV